MAIHKASSYLNFKYSIRKLPSSVRTLVSIGKRKSPRNTGSELPLRNTANKRRYREVEFLFLLLPARTPGDASRLKSGLLCREIPQSFSSNSFPVKKGAINPLVNFAGIAGDKFPSFQRRAVAGVSAESVDLVTGIVGIFL